MLQIKSIISNDSGEIEGVLLRSKLFFFSMFQTPPNVPEKFEILKSGIEHLITLLEVRLSA